MPGEEFGGGIDMRFSKADGCRRFTDARGDELQFALEGAHVADSEDARKRCPVEIVHDNLVLDDFETPIFDRTKCRFEPDVDNYRICGEFLFLLGSSVFEGDACEDPVPMEFGHDLPEFEADPCIVSLADALFVRPELIAAVHDGDGLSNVDQV